MQAMRRLAQLRTADFRLQALGVFALALVARLIHLWQLRGSSLLEFHLGDAAGYHAWAQRIAAGDWLGSEVFYQAPLYPYFLSLIYATLGETWAPRVVQAAMGALACALLALAGRRLFSPRVGLLAGLGLALYPSALFFDGLIQKSALDNLLICLLLWLFSRTLDEAVGTRAWLWVGLALGALILTRENALVLLLPVGLWLALSGPREPRRRGLAGLALVAGLALLLGPVALRNAAVGGAFHLTTSQSGPNFYIGNHAGASGIYQPLRYGRGRVDFESKDATELAEQALGRALAPDEVSAFWRDRALADIRAEPGRWLRLLGRKFALVWNATEIEDTEDQLTYSRHSWLLRSASLFHFGTLAPLALLGVWQTRRRWRELWLLYGCVLTYAASVVLFYVMARYRFPLVPFLMLFAAAGVAGAWEWFTSRSAAAAKGGPGRRRELAWAAALVAAFALFCNWPLRDPAKGEITTQINLARALQESGELTRAANQLEQALELDPEHPLAHSNLADVLYLQGRFAEAIQHYHRALATAPDDSRSRNNLGLALAATGDTDSALEQYRLAVELDPRHAEALNNLAGALARRGRVEEALELYADAIEAQPDYVDAVVNRATVLAAIGRSPEALETLRAAAGRLPDHPDIRLETARLHSRLGQVDEALAAYQSTVQLAPRHAAARFELGRALGRRGRSAEAVEQLRAAAQLEPSARHLNALAFVLATRTGASEAEVAEALGYARRAASLTQGNDPMVLTVLAAAEAASGDFDAAIATVRRALDLAQRSRDQRLARSLSRQLDAYENGESYGLPLDRSS